MPVIARILFRVVRTHTPTAGRGPGAAARAPFYLHSLPIRGPPHHGPQRGCTRRIPAPGATGGQAPGACPASKGLRGRGAVGLDDGDTQLGLNTTGLNLFL